MISGDNNVIKFFKSYAKYMAIVIVGIMVIGVFAEDEPEYIDPNVMADEIRFEMKGIMSVVYDSSTDTYQMEIIDQGFYTDVVNLVHYDIGIEEWKNVVLRVEALSIESMEKTGMDSKIIIVNPDAPSKRLLIVQGGSYTYNVLVDGIN